MDIMFYELSITTKAHTEFVDITDMINESISKSGIKKGVCYIYVPHTTAGVTINENADPDVVYDMLNQLNKIVPFEDNYRHMEGNSAAHIKASMMGFSQHVIINNGNLVLGTWQGIYLTEFDGPRRRKVYLKLMEG
jgi:secondary thiamine-phosphate synthase enzyme